VDETYLDPVGYASLDEDEFPVGVVWSGSPLGSRDLTAFTGYYRGDRSHNGYDYWAPLAWTGLMVRLLEPAPPAVTVLAGFSGGDWLTFSPGRPT
jgi:hypothetical protein